MQETFIKDEEEFQHSIADEYPYTNIMFKRLENLDCDKKTSVVSMPNLKKIEYQTFLGKPEYDADIIISYVVKPRESCIKSVNKDFIYLSESEVYIKRNEIIGLGKVSVYLKSNCNEIFITNTEHNDLKELIEQGLYNL